MPPASLRLHDLRKAVVAAQHSWETRDLVVRLGFPWPAERDAAAVQRVKDEYNVRVNLALVSARREGWDLLGPTDLASSGKEGRVTVVDNHGVPWIESVTFPLRRRVSQPTLAAAPLAPAQTSSAFRPAPRSARTSGSTPWRELTLGERIGTTVVWIVVCGFACWVLWLFAMSVGPSRSGGSNPYESSESCYGIAGCW